MAGRVLEFLYSRCTFLALHNTVHRHAETDWKLASVITMAWEELTSDELARLLRREVMDLSSDLRLKYDRYAVSPIRMEYSWDLAGQRVSKPI
jgi:hypothetical protein